MNTEGHEGDEARTSFTTSEDVPIAAPPVTSCVVTSKCYGFESVPRHDGDSI